MDSQISIALLTGGFTIAGGISVAVISAWLSRFGEKRKVRDADDRRWLTDRRVAYAKYLGMAESLLREIDSVAAFLSYDGVNEIPAEDEELLKEGLYQYFSKWEESLQPLLGEVQLLSMSEVADLADRVSGALMEVTWRVEKRKPFKSSLRSWRVSRGLETSAACFGTALSATSCQGNVACPDDGRLRVPAPFHGSWCSTLSAGASSGTKSGSIIGEKASGGILLSRESSSGSGGVLPGFSLMPTA